MVSSRSNGHEEIDDERLVGAIARVDRQQPHETPCQQTGADQQHDGQRDLGDHQALPHALARPAAGDAARAFGERVTDALLRCASGRHHAQGDGGQQRNTDRERHHRPVHLHVLDARKIARLHHGQCADAGERDGDTDKGRRGGQHDRFGEELSRDAAPARTDRQPHGDLPPARRRARQLQVRHVEAGDDEEQNGSAEEHEEDRSSRGGELLAKRNGGRIRHPGAIAVTRFQGLGDADSARERALSTVPAPSLPIAWKLCAVREVCGGLSSRGNQELARDRDSRTTAA